MREKYDTSIAGQFDSSMAEYIYYQLAMSGDFGDEDISDGNGEWLNRYGKRILSGDTQGFVALDKFDTEAEAEAEFARIAATPQFAASEDDAYIESNGFKYSASVAGKHVGEFSEWDDAIAAVKAECGDNYFPNLWSVDDHGGMTLVEEWS